MRRSARPRCAAPSERGREVIRRYATELDEAERLVNEQYFAWRRSEPTSTGPALDAMLVRWQALANDDELVVHWEPSAASGRRRR